MILSRNKLYPPRKLFLLSMFLWIVIYISSPFTPIQKLNLEWYFFVFICALSFIIGTLLIKNLKYQFKIDKTVTLTKFYKFLILALSGLVLKIYDRFIIRGISFNNLGLENRELSELGSGNFIGMLGSLLAPLSYYTFYLLLKENYPIKKYLKFLIFTLPLLQILDTLALGSRSAFFIVIALTFCILLSHNKLNFKLKNAFKFLIIITGILILLQVIFLKRTSEFIDEKDLKYTVMEMSGYNYTLETGQSIKNYIYANENTVSSILFTYVITTKYYLHGLFELNTLILDFDQPHQFGGYTFLLYNRLISKLTGNKLDESIFHIMPRNGIYTSFLGPIFVDFGWLSPLFLMIFGAFCQISFNKFILGRNEYAMIYVYLSVVIVFFPVFNFISGANGLYTFSSFLFIRLLTKKPNNG